MPTVVSEVGTMVAENVASILASVDGTPPAPNAQVWQTLSSGGWGAIAADPENEVGLRDILEVARSTGSFPYTTPLVATLLAGRWHGFDEEQLSSGVALVLSQDGEAVAPYYSEGVQLLDGTGALREAVPSFVDDFSLLNQVAAVAPDTVPVEGRQLDEVRASYLAVATGCADAAISTACAWAETREQFGQAIKGFQAVRHHLADAHIAREQVWTTAIAAAHEGEDSARWAKQGFALARTAIELSIQVHGGVGFTWEVGLQHYLNQVLALDSLLGGAR